ncbi:MULTISPECIES: cytidine deaminase [unclassified Streptomyces]|uniref:cytidine deaminase n=1 Tax=unclassified Streptomyces TaxID=2593676 RepID=UPI00081E58EB|nr:MULTISPECIES: cytidine deaminase [unclassified Streptomyces]SCF37431.1 cytidine deaminase [Streptomyces sp. LcepLS]
MHLDQGLVNAAVELMDRRWPAGEPRGAAAVRLADGGVFTGVGLDSLHGSVALCQETGTFVQAYTRDRDVVASVRVCRDLERGRVLVLPPCGICQEWLALWGAGGEVAAPREDDPTAWEPRTLAEVNPVLPGPPVRRRQGAGPRPARE